MGDFHPVPLLTWDASVSTDPRLGCRLSNGRGGAARPGLHHLHQDHHHPGAGRDPLLARGGEQKHDEKDGDEVRGVHHREAAAVGAPPSTGSRTAAALLLDTLG